MKTEAELKKLAEFAAEFLGWEIEDGRLTIPSFCLRVGLYLCDDPHVKYLFEHPETAPIFAHLALREMEKRGWDISMKSTPSGIGLHFSYSFHQDYVGGVIGPFDNNYFIALWSAIEKTGEK